MPSRTLLVCGVLCGLARGALADEPPPPEPPPTPPPAQPILVAPVPDLQSVIDQFEHAFDDLIARRYDEAASGFDRVAATTTDLQRRLLAIELARRAHVLAERALRVRAADRSRDGRYGLLIGSSVVGLALYGPTIVDLESGSGSKVQVGSYMLAAGASFFLPYLATRDEPVTWGMTDAFWYGATRGAYHGAMVLELFHSNDASATDKQILGSMSVGSILEGGAATYWAAHTHASAGLTNAMSKGGDYGALFGMAIASTAMASDKQDARGIAAGGLVGSVAGIYGGYLLAQHRDLTWGDSEALRATVLVGVGAAAVPLILGDSDNHRVILPTLMAGAVGGFVVGDLLVDGHDFSPGQGIVTELSTLAGAGAGAGLGYLISPDNDSSSRDKIVIIGAVLGAAGGFTLAYLGLDTTAHPRESALPISIQIVPQLGPDQKGVSVAGSF